MVAFKSPFLLTNSTANGKLGPISLRLQRSKGKHCQQSMHNLNASAECDISNR